MWVKSGPSLASRLDLRGRLFNRRILTLVVYTLVVFLIGVSAHRSGLIRKVARPLRNWAEVPGRLSALTASPDRIEIDIKLRDYLEIVKKREDALAARLLVASAEDFVPATLRVEGRSIPARLRLKGDLQDHWAGDKWSYRIRLRNGESLWGMREFSIQDPSTRSFLSEWLYHENLKRGGLPALRYRFVDVTVNGKAMGIYALEEHFGKELIERAGLREGPIVRFDEDASWKEVRDQGWLTYTDPRALTGSGAYLASGVDGFNSNAWLDDEARREQYLQAVHLLEGFRRGLMPPSEVFDLPKLAKFFAISDLHGAAHATSWRNCRFYYNPVTARLEPIGFDGTSNPPPVQGIIPMWPALIRQAGFYRQHYYDTILSDMEFYAEYLRALEIVAREGYLESLLEELDSELKLNERILHRDFPDFSYSAESLYENRRYIRSVLNPPKAIHAHLVSATESQFEIQIGNLQILPVEVLGLQLGELTVPPVVDTVLAGRPFDGLVNYQRIVFSVPALASQPDSSVAGSAVRYRLLGTDSSHQEPVIPWRPFVEADHESIVQSPPDFHDRDWILVDDEHREIRSRPGHWRLTRDLILPKGYRFIVGPGTILELAGASIVSRSAIELTGDVESPVMIRATDSGGGGLLVLETDGVSLLENVVFEGLSAPGDARLNLTGAVTFYEAAVTIRGCRFRQARAEDALNLVRSPFEIVTSRFIGGDSDALDADFSDGEISDTDIESPTNDGIDISGSAVRLSQVRIRGAGDKALSAGESSRLAGGGLEIERSRVAVASKDLSRVILFNVSVKGSEIGLAAYQKKTEFGPGAIEVENLRMERVIEPLWIEEGSSITVDGETTAGNRTEPQPVFYPDG